MHSQLFSGFALIASMPCEHFEEIAPLEFADSALI
jgi:hypothetical protein